MKRNYLKQLLHDYHPTDPHEISCKQEMLKFIESHENCFERSLACGHITASAWVVNKDNSQALLTHHAKFDDWYQLGGHCDGESNVLEVALKEAREESGIQAIEPVNTEIFDIDIHYIPATAREKEHWHYDVRFLLRVTSDEAFVVSHESKDLRWVDKDVAALPTDNATVIRMCNKWIERG